MDSIIFNKKKLQKIIQFYRESSLKMKNVEFQINAIRRKEEIYHSPCFYDNEVEVNASLKLLQKEKLTFEVEHICIESFIKDFNFKLEEVKNIYNESYYDMFYQHYLNGKQLTTLSVEYGGLNEGNISREITKIATAFLNRIDGVYNLSQLQYQEINKFRQDVIEAYKETLRIKSDNNNDNKELS